jgi:hypothetical protein
MKRGPIRGILSAGVVVQFAVLLCSVPSWAQSGGQSGGIPLGPVGPDAGGFSKLDDTTTKPETHVLSGDHAPGDIHGVVRYPGGLPAAGAQVVILDAEVDVDRSTTSAEDGSFTFKKLKPGKYQLSAQLDGFAPSTIVAAAVIPGKTNDFDVSLGSKRDSILPARSSGIGYRSLSGGYRAAAASLRVDPPQPSSPTGNEEAVPAAGAPSATSSSAPEKTSAAAPSEAIPPAVADQLAAMARRIDELEAELRARSSPEQPAPAAAPATAAVATTSAAAVPKPADPVPAIPEALQSPDATTGVDNFTPFAFANFGWMNGTSRATDPIFDTKFFTPEIRFDSYFTDDFNHPIDHTMGGSSEEFRSGEFQLEQASVGGDFHWHDARGRVIIMNGMFATTTPRNDASAGVGGWDIDSAYKYVSEAYGGYHFNYLHGINIDAGIFVSYIGLFSYYNFDNWAYQPSYVSSNTPWFFNGLRIQVFPTNKLKIEPWLINGWQSYNKYNARIGLGGQILWRPFEWLGFVFNNYGMGTDNLGEPLVSRIHTDDSFLIRYYNHPDSLGLSKIAMSFTGDLGCQYGGGVGCFNSHAGPRDSFAGWMAYNRFWFHKDEYAVTVGGGQMANPGRYLTLLPPINQAVATTGTPYFTENPGNVADMWDSTITFQWMPRTWATWWLEGSYRHSNVPYWTGRGGITPPGGVNGSPQDYVCTNGTTNFVDTYFLPTGAGFQADNAAGSSSGGLSNTGGTVDRSCAAQAVANPGIGSSSGWYAWQPDLRKDQSLIGAGIMIKF